MIVRRVGEEIGVLSTGALETLTAFDESLVERGEVHDQAFAMGDQGCDGEVDDLVGDAEGSEEGGRGREG